MNLQGKPNIRSGPSVAVPNGKGHRDRIGSAAVQPGAPPVYRLQPRNSASRLPVVQPKAGVRPAVPPVYSPRQSQIQPKQPSAPPVYRPELRSSAGNFKSGRPAIQLKRGVPPGAPPVYSPSRSASVRTSAPPAYRPQTANPVQRPPAVQRKSGVPSGAPPVYCPNGRAGEIQAKPGTPPPVYRPQSDRGTNRQPVPRVGRVAPVARQSPLVQRSAIQRRLPPSSSRSGFPGAGTIQPKVGFEFETSWELALTKAGTGVPNGGNEIPLPAKKKLFGQEGWSLHADFNKTKVAEFVTDPVEESDGFGLMMQVSNLESYTSDIVASDGVAGRGGDWVKLKENKDAELWIKKGDADMKAAPQVTAGIRLDRMIPLMKAMSKGRNLPGPQELLNKPTGEGAEKIARLMREATKRAEEYYAGLSTTEKAAPGMNLFAGAIALLGLYALLGKEHAQLEYAKELSPLMARTNLGKLPDSVKNHPKFRTGIRHVAGIKASEINLKLFRQGFQGTTVTGPTFKEWIAGIKSGDDPLRALSANQMSNLDRLEGVGPTTLNFDTFEEDFEAQGLIVELRGMQEGLPYNKWHTLAYRLHEYIKHLNSSTDDGKYAASNAYPSGPAVAPVHAPTNRTIPGLGSANLRPVNTKVTSDYYAKPVEGRVV